ncbi:heat shock protein transcriptional repressor HspR [Acidipropionibacterium timonense]|uniref:heat shock protein transcriptional repressor HspR n=1 Tax=Acidipropionibacterium timonense TaxID=2161818 RepID=UPI001031650A|nr:helix-turn-helix transcriptional regulator [Acidipropionibacterium timonense]
MRRRVNVGASGLARIDRDAPIFPISAAAELAGMHPQTLRTYDRLGLVVPTRARGRGRRYSAADVANLRMIQHLSQDEGINLNGIHRIMELERQIVRLNDQVEQLSDTVRRMQSVEFEGRSDPRVFTAESTGRVHMGRTVVRTQLALPPR